MEKRTDSFQDLYSELEDFEKYGIAMKMDGVPASPLQIATAHLVKEECSYMRDYILGIDGKLVELDFHDVNKHNHDDPDEE